MDEARIAELERRVRAIEALHDVQESSWVKLTLFVLLGWPLRRVVARPQRRPWRQDWRWR